MKHKNKFGPYYNVGVMYFTNSEKTQHLIGAWMEQFPGPLYAWHENGALITLSMIPQWGELVIEIDARYNSCRAGNNRVEDAIVEGFHGEGCPEQRFELMKAFLEKAKE